MGTRTMPHAGVVAALALVVMLVPACGGDDGGTADPTDAADGTVSITLKEFAVVTEPASAAAGAITFSVTNEGPDDVHEFVVIATDLQPTELPTEDDGSVSETGEGMEVIDEIEDIPVGEAPKLAVDLDAGNYVLICNILEDLPDGTFESHYAEGMRTGFTVE